MRNSRLVSCQRQCQHISKPPNGFQHMNSIIFVQGPPQNIPHSLSLRPSRTHPSRRRQRLLQLVQLIKTHFQQTPVIACPRFAQELQRRQSSPGFRIGVFHLRSEIFKLFENIAKTFHLLDDSRKFPGGVLGCGSVVVAECDDFAGYL